jgi:hypothetical protein
MYGRPSSVRAVSRINEAATGIPGTGRAGASQAGLGAPGNAAGLPAMAGFEAHAARPNRDNTSKDATTRGRGSDINSILPGIDQTRQVLHSTLTH